MSQARRLTARWRANTVKNTERIKVNSFIISMGSNCDCLSAHEFTPTSVLIFSGNGEAIATIASAYENPLACIGADLPRIGGESGIAAGLVRMVFQVLPVHGYR